MWVWAGIAWLLAGLLVALILGEHLAPKTALERKLDDEAQIRALRAYAERQEHNRLKAKIPEGEA